MRQAQRPGHGSHILVVLALCVSVLASSVATAGERASEEIDSLLAKATEQGTVRVLAHLDVPAAPEASLAAADVVAQRRAIATSAALLESDLAGTTWSTIRTFRTIPYVALDVSPDALRALDGSPVVLDVTEDRLEKPMLSESVPQIGADLAWEAGYDGTGWVVAVLDSGVSSSHPFLAGKVVSEACFSLTRSCPNGASEQIGPGAGAPCTYAPIGCAHGTHVAGIASGRGSSFSGTARGAGIVAIQVFSRFTGSDCDDDIEDPCIKSYTSDTIAALERVYELRGSFRIAAVNLSLGGRRYASQEQCDLADGARKAAIDNLRAAGIATVAAAGNGFDAGALSAPACISSAFSVGAVTRLDGVASFSNSAAFLDFLAPGSGIQSSTPPDGFDFMSGTSQATPHVAGAFAILSQRLGHADVEAVATALRSTGVPITDARNGLVKPRIAVHSALDALSAVRCRGRAATIVGSEGPDRIVGTPGPDVVAGLGGDDVIDGRGGDDTICGGPGDDVLRGGSGADDVSGEGGADVLRGGPGDDVLDGGPGDDRLWGDAGWDALKGGSGRDLLAGGAGNDRLKGQQGGDTLVGSSGLDVCAGGPGQDAERSCEVVDGVP